MTIEASLRRPQIAAKDPGGVVADSKPTKAQNPQLVMEPGVVRPAFKFDDGGGLTDSFGNVYEGYDRAGGSSVIVNQDPPKSVSGSILDNANDKDLIVYDGADELYKPRPISFFEEVPLTEVATPDDFDILVYKTSTGLWEFEPVTFFDIAVIDSAQVVDDGDFLIANASGQFLSVNFEDAVAQIQDDNFDGFFTTAIAASKISDFISGIIQTPQNRAYTVVRDLPYDIEITSSSTSGPSSVSFPSGIISAGDPVSITISGASGSEEFLSFQITFERTLEAP
jgi:hypothetical protein